ncbi:MAG: TrmH family RNA methyltransferase, partial [Bacteroidota bacterium]
ALVKELMGAGAQVQCLEQTAQSVRLQDFTPMADQLTVLVVGNEVKGVQQSIINLANGTIEIEQFGTKHSLNVAVAGGAAIYALSSSLRKQ